MDPEKQKRAEAELADVKQSLKKAAKVKKDQLFTAYLDGTETSATAWKKRYCDAEANVGVYFKLKELE